MLLSAWIVFEFCRLTRCEGVLWMCVRVGLSIIASVLPHAGILLDSQLEDEQEDVCATCLEQYTVQNPKTFTECGHHFHLQCIFEWLNRKETCPICETPMHIPGLL